MAAEQEDFFSYTKAVVREIPASLPGAALRLDSNGEPVDLNNAHLQHREYIKVGMYSASNLKSGFFETTG